MDNALENFYSLLEPIGLRYIDTQVEPDGISINVRGKQAVVHALKQRIRSKRDTVIFRQIRDKKGLERNIRVDYVLLPYGKQVDGRNVVVERFYDEKEMNRYLRAAITHEGGSRTCVLCNKSFERNLDELKQGVYPLATKNRALSGIRRKSDYIGELCATCFVIGVLEWTDDGLPYRCGLGDHSIVLFPQFSSFKDLVQFKGVSRQILGVGDLTSNIKVSPLEVADSYTGGEHSSLLLFIEQLIKRLLKQKTGGTVLEEALKRTICKDWVCLKIPSGIVKDVKCSSIKIDDTVIDIASSVTKLLQEDKKEIVAEPGIYSDIIAKLDIRPEPGRPLSFDRLQELRFQSRELLAQSFLKGDLHSFVDPFLPRRGIYIKPTTELIGRVEILMAEWQFKPIGLSEHDIESIRKSADVLAEACTMNAGLLYQMDRAQTAQDFVFTLKEGAKKLVGIADEVAAGTIKVTPSSLGAFFQLLTARETQWKLLRDALVLYTAIAYSSKKSSRGA